MNDYTFRLDLITAVINAQETKNVFNALADRATKQRAFSASHIAAVKSLLVQSARSALNAINQEQVAVARAQALGHPRCLHPRSHGATLFGLDPSIRISADWAAWANTIATTLNENPNKVEKDKGSRLFDSDFVPVLLAVAQQAGASGDDLLQGIAVACYSYRELLTVTSGKSLPGLQGTWAALAIACGMVRCLRLNKPLALQVMESIQQDVSLCFLPIAEVARHVVTTIDQRMRVRDFDQLDDEQFNQNCMGLNYCSCDPTIEDDFMAFKKETRDILSPAVQTSFLRRVGQLAWLDHAELMQMNPVVDRSAVNISAPDGKGIF